MPDPAADPTPDFTPDPTLDHLNAAALDPVFWPPSRTGVHSAWIAHVPFAHWLVAAHRPRCIVELGTHTGVSYAAFCEAVQRTRLDCRCLAVDTWQGDEHAGQYDNSVFESLNAFHAARYAGFSELLRCTFDAALPYVPDASIDLLHIDGLHTFDAVRHDFESWLPKLSSRAVVVLHDTNVRERGFGVWRLFHALSQRYPHFEFLHGHGLGILAIGAEPGPAIRALTTLPEGAASTLRDRFAVLGERWRAGMALDQAAADLAQAQATSAEAQKDAQAAILAATLAARGDADRERARHATEAAVLRHAVAATADYPEAYRQAGEHIANLETLLEQARGDRDRNAALLHQVRTELHVLRSSTAWRATGPARRAARHLRALLSVPGRTPPEPEPAVPPPAEPPPPLPIAALRPPPPVRDEAVDIVICVHDAPDSLRACLDSVLRGTMPPFRVILVDDGSGPDTAALIDREVRDQGFTLHRNAEAAGYTRAANAGLRLSTAPWTVLLNSDTVVAPGWLDRMWAHGARDPALGIIGPLSNTASWQSVPRLFDEAGTDWADNPLPAGLDVDAMGRLVAGCALGAVPLPFINGFCLMLRRTVLDGVGLFDEATFGAGYGEENDYAIRARAGGWTLAVATDAYVFHAQSMSYAGRRAALSRDADRLLLQKHDPALHILPQAAACRNSLLLAAMRARVGAAVRGAAVLAGGRRFEGRRVAFILPIAERGGGGAVVLQESQALLRLGVDVTVLTLDIPNAILGPIPELSGLHVRSFPSPEAMTAHLVAEPDRYDAVVATLYSTVYWLPPRPGFRCAYYVQDWEPLFFEPGGAEHQAALLSYTHSDHLRLVTKTRWNQAEVLRHTGRTPVLLGPSVDTAAFAPGPARDPAGPVRIAAMVRPATPRRAPARTMAVLHQVRARLGERVALHVFGASAAELDAAGLDAEGITVEGKLGGAALAALLARTDIVLDASDYQAMGLTALEAMLAGCAVVGPARGGSGEFIRSGENGILVDTANETACTAAILDLVADPARLHAIRLAAVADANRFGPEHAAARLLAALFDD